MTLRKTNKHDEFNKNVAYGIDRVAYYTGMAVGTPITVPIAVVGISAIYVDSTARYALYLPGQMLQQLYEIYENMPLVKEKRKREEASRGSGSFVQDNSTKEVCGGKTIKIIPISKYSNGLTQNEALAAVKKRKLRLLTNKEIDAILQNDNLQKEYSDYFPIWTGTHVDYSGTDCAVTELEKKYVCEMPEKDGWYEQDKFGIPFGNPSNSNNLNARYLFRVSNYSGLLSRSYGGFGNFRRGVDAYGRYVSRLGVLATPLKQNKQKIKARKKVN
ncbi:MAG: hypothetical protein WC476_13115 [Phycisphaerae bacterium]|jgi:hypothetical protein